MSEGHSRINSFLTRLLLGLACCLMACITFVGWRISQFVYTLDQSMAAISKDVAQVTGSAALVAKKVEEAAARLEQLELHSKQLMSVQETVHMIDEFAELQQLRRENHVQLDKSSQSEIDYLLACVRDSQSRFGHENDNDIRTAATYYVRLYAKYKTYNGALTSAEDFIEKVASRTVGGNAYFIFGESGEKRPLADWLTEKLAARRKELK